VLFRSNPIEALESVKKAGARKVIFHYEASKAPGAVILAARKLGLEVGLAINPETQVSAFSYLLGEVDSILLMAVHPGFYGAKFLPEVLDKVKEIRQSKSDSVIGVDGGMKENNVAFVAGLGVDMICVGSAIFMQPDPASSFKKLSRLAVEGSKAG
jgi:ribulose-phosphate 3-epimerase